MKRTLAVLFGVAAIPLAGCGSSDDPEPAAVSSASGGAAVRMVDNAFEAKDVTVSAGDTVTWTNAGALPHTATGDSFDSGSVAPGETFTITVRGRPVARLGPPQSAAEPSLDVDPATILRLLADPVDPELARDLDAAEAPLDDPWRE